MKVLQINWVLFLVCNFAGIYTMEYPQDANWPHIIQTELRQLHAIASSPENQFVFHVKRKGEKYFSYWSFGSVIDNGRGGTLTRKDERICSNDDAIKIGDKVSKKILENRTNEFHILISNLRDGECFSFYGQNVYSQSNIDN